ncbi:MAG TPA: recombination regulator RecX [Bacilli bacterium]|nr:recombination regulator RecX [Bacilli bacterium]
MTKITKITTQKRNKHRYNIFIEKNSKEQYAFSVEEETLISEGLKKGLVLDRITMEHLMRADHLNKTYNKVLNYLSYRMRSTEEVRTYLLEHELEEEQIQVLIDRLNRQKLLDDQAFANAFVKTKVNSGFRGPGQIRTELFQKGIKQSLIEQALTCYSESDQVERIEAWLTKQIKKTTRQSHRQQMNKLKQQLLQKGFDHSIIEHAFQQITFKKDEQEEWQSLVYQGEKALRRYQTKAEGYLLLQKIKASLYRKGFNQELINRFIEQHVDSN